MIITQAHIAGDKRVHLLGDDAKRYHLISKDAATGWMRQFSVVPTLASIAPATVVAAAGTVTIVLTGTAFLATHEVTVNNIPVPKTFTNATTMSITISKNVVAGSKIDIGVLVLGFYPVLSPRAFTFT